MLLILRYICPCSLHVAELQRLFLIWLALWQIVPPKKHQHRGIVFCTSVRSTGHTIYIFSTTFQKFPASWVSRCSWTSQWDLCHSPAASFLTPGAPCGPSATWCRGWAGEPGTRSAAGPTFSSDPGRSKQRGRLADVDVWSASVSNRFHCRLTSWSVCLLTFRTDFRFSIDTCVMAACSLCSFRKLLYSSRAFCSSSMRFCKYLGSFPKCCKKQEEMFTSYHVKIGRMTFLNVFFMCTNTLRKKQLPSFWSTWEQALNSQEAACLPWWSSHWQAVASWAQLWLSWWSSSWSQCPSVEERSSQGPAASCQSKCGSLSWKAHFLE